MRGPSNIAGTVTMATWADHVKSTGRKNELLLNALSGNIMELDNLKKKYKVHTPRLYSDMEMYLFIYVWLEKLVHFQVFYLRYSFNTIGFMLVSLLIVKQTSPSNKREHSFRPVAKHAIMLYAISRLNVTHIWPISWALKLTCYREYNSTSLGGGIKVTLASTEWWCYSARDGDMKLGETQWSACPQSGCPIHAL